MESRWYLYEGQTLANTKIADRANALHINSKAWQGIHKHLDRKKRAQEELAKEKEYQNFLKTETKAMTQNWDNSIANIRKTKKEERERELQLEKDERTKHFFQLRQEQEVIRKEFLAASKRKTYLSTGYPKAITSGYITSEILFERQKQIEFNQMIKQHEIEEEQKYAAKIKEGALKEIEEREEVRRNMLKKKRHYGNALKKLIKEKQFLLSKETEGRLQNEVTENTRAAIEIALLDNMEKENKQLKKREAMAEMKKNFATLEEERKKLEQEEKDFEEAVEIQREAQFQMNCLTKLKREEAIREKGERRALIAEKIFVQKNIDFEKEEAIIRNAEAEKDAADAATILAKLEFNAKIKEDRLNERRKQLEREAKQKIEEDELRKWEMLNRFKTREAQLQYEEGRKKELWQQVINYRNELLEQIEDNKKEVVREKLIDYLMAVNNYPKDDEKFFEYAEEILELAKKKGRSTFPIEKVIIQYKKENFLPLSDDKNCEELVGKKGNSSKESCYKPLKKHHSCKCWK